MKNKRIIIFSSLVLIILIGGIIYIKYLNNSRETIVEEYIPKEEFEEERKTIVNIYFEDKEFKEIKAEGRIFDTKELITDPYTNIINIMIDGPKSNKLTKLFPENVKLINYEIKDDEIKLNFNEELLNYGDEINKNKIIESLVRTLTEFNEINKIKIIINNEENNNFNEIYN